MATRATIVLEIPEDRISKEYTFTDGNMFKYSTPSTTIPEGVKYVSIYNHFDGGVDSLGKDLVMLDGGFDKLMSRIICGGNCSYIGSPYKGNRDEEWQYTKPKFSCELPEVTESYQYVYKTDNKWYVRASYDMEYKNLTCISPSEQQVSNAIADIADNIECLKTDVEGRIAKIIEKLDELKETVGKIEGMKSKKCDVYNLDDIKKLVRTWNEQLNQMDECDRILNDSRLWNNGKENWTEDDFKSIFKWFEAYFKEFELVGEKRKYYDDVLAQVKKEYDERYKK